VRGSYFAYSGGVEFLSWDIFQYIGEHGGLERGGCAVRSGTFLADDCPRAS